LTAGSAWRREANPESIAASVGGSSDSVAPSPGAPAASVRAAGGDEALQLLIALGERSGEVGGVVHQPAGQPALLGQLIGEPGGELDEGNDVDERLAQVVAAAREPAAEVPEHRRQVRADVGTERVEHVLRLDRDGRLIGAERCRGARQSRVPGAPRVDLDHHVLERRGRLQLGDRVAVDRPEAAVDVCGDHRLIAVDEADAVDPAGLDALELELLAPPADHARGVADGEADLLARAVDVLRDVLDDVEGGGQGSGGADHDRGQRAQRAAELERHPGPVHAVGEASLVDHRFARPRIAVSCRTLSVSREAAAPEPEASGL
jgi:hypothetical protein